MWNREDKKEAMGRMQAVALHRINLPDTDGKKDAEIVLKSWDELPPGQFKDALATMIYGAFVVAPYLEDTSLTAMMLKTKYHD